MLNFSQEKIFAKIFDFISQNPNGVLALTGPTASGKTTLGFELIYKIQKIFAKNCEIICVDSRQVYLDIDISSAKPSINDRAGVSHHGLDLIPPTQEYTVVNFQKYAFSIIQEIQLRGNIPLLVGGTMLWIDAICLGYNFGPKGEKSEKFSRKFPSFLFGIHREREALYERINQRAVAQFQSGLIEESRKIRKKYGDKLTRQVKTSFGYSEIFDHLDGKINFDECLAKNQQRNRNYAKRQMTWWRGRKDMSWINVL